MFYFDIAYKKFQLMSITPSIHGIIYCLNVLRNKFVIYNESQRRNEILLIFIIDILQEIG